jgi:tRNA(fMet)-specific endonuclease VapC
MTQRYLLDTNVISHIMQGRDAKLLAKLSKLPMGQAAISSVTLAEIEYGIQRRG